jgi:hypothetical protein
MRGKTCIVFNSQTRGTPSRVIECVKGGRRSADVTQRLRSLNRSVGMGGFYSAHPERVIRGWIERGETEWKLP